MESFEQLANQYQPMIHKIIHTLKIYKNIDEFYQIGLIALWEAQKNYQEEKGCFHTFAYTMIKGQILHQLARDKKHEERTVFPEQGYWEYVIDPPTDQLMTFMKSNVPTLTEKETKWLTKACHIGLSVKEIAKSENVSASTVKQWRKSAREKLREQLHSAF